MISVNVSISRNKYKKKLIWKITIKFQKNLCNLLSNYILLILNVCN